MSENNQEVQTTVATALRTALAPATYQLGVAASKTDGVANTAVNAAINAVNQIEIITLGQYDSEIEEFNALCDEVEAMDIERVKAVDAARLLSEEMGGYEHTAEASKTRISILEADEQIYKLNITDLKRDLKALLELDPKQLKKTNGTLRQKVKETQTLLNAQKLKIRDLNRDVEKKSQDYATRTAEVAHLTNENLQIRDQLIYSDGDVVDRKPYPAKHGSKIEFYIYSFGWCVGVKYAEGNVKIINDIDWHIVVRSNTNIHAGMVVSEWLTPCFPHIEQFKDCWPENLTEDLKNIILQRFEKSHPELVARHQWAKDTQLESIGITEKVVELMNDNNIFSVYDVVEKHEKKLSDDIKGFGEAGERSLRAKCGEAVKAWETEQAKSLRLASKAA